ncbi:MAG: ABC transporter ATP-binding protein [Sumerlaeia bacterium]
MPKGNPNTAPQHAEPEPLSPGPGNHESTHHCAEFTSTSSEVAIHCNRLTKEFPIHIGGAKSIKEMALKGIFHQGKQSTFRALEDVSFTLKKGESLALIGKNGSGKSTLLKLIAGVSTPTNGTIQVNGRVVALLELGAAFHPELTGMENIFFQNSILGIPKEQTLAMLDEIIAFSELQDFIHTQIKRYSSGMRMRLAFALATRQQGDILIIDEVLAVGDNSFRARCLQRLLDLKDQGKAILFVSHQMDQVGLVADSVLWLDQGKVVDQGTVGKLVPVYLNSYFEYEKPQTPQNEQPDNEQINSRNQSQQQSKRSQASELDNSVIDLKDTRRFYVMATSQVGVRGAHNSARILDVQFLNRDNQPSQTFETGDALIVEVIFSTSKPLPQIEVLMGFSGFEDLPVAIQGTEQQGLAIRNVEGTYRVRGVMNPFPVFNGRFKVSIALSDPSQENCFFDSHLEVYSFHVHSPEKHHRDPENYGIMQPPGLFLINS